MIHAITIDGLYDQFDESLSNEIEKIQKDGGKIISLQYQAFIPEKFGNDIYEDTLGEKSVQHPDCSLYIIKSVLITYDDCEIHSIEDVIL